MSKHRWDSSNVPDQTGRVAIVTGSSSGIGIETARVLAEKNATVIIAVRNLDKGNRAAEQIASKHKSSDLRVMEVDLASLESVRKFASRFKVDYDRLDLLINNAGVMMPPYSKTADGFELQFGTNHLGHFALTGLLLDLILKTENSRVVTVSSTGHRYGKLNFDDLNWEKRKYSKMRTYADSKIQNLYFTYELQRKLEKAGKSTIAAAAHPGWTATELQRHAGLFRFLNNFMAQNIEMGALPTLMAAADPGVRGGDYFGPGGRREMRGYPKKVDSNELSRDKDIARRLWTVSEELTGVRYDV
ncbi:SDR family NAD(P)-dependent oxidoreductase [Acidobacteriota bacterium]